MPSPSSTALSALYNKEIVASSVRSAEWDIVPVWCRERAFFSATVESHKTLGAMRDKVAGILAGQLSPAEARRDLREILASQGYTPTPGTAGTIKDLDSYNRMQVVLNTNVEMCQGYAQRQVMLGSISYPAQEFVRVRQSRVPRDNWDARWATAAASVGYEGVSRTSKIALLNSPIWAALSVFGTPYPPFDYGSGMGVAPVRFDDAVAAGIIDDQVEEDIVKLARDRHLEAMNADLEAPAENLNASLRDSLAEHLQGFARWEGDVLKFVDPNGSRPVSWQEAGDVMCAKLPSGFAQPQKEAIAAWIKDSSMFDIRQEGEHQKYEVGLNMRESAWRAIDRIIPTNQEDSGTIYRGMTMSSKDKLEEFIKGCKKHFYSPQPHKIADSWSTSLETAERFSKNKDANWRVVVVAKEYKSGKRIDGIARKLSEQGLLENQTPQHPHITEGEVLMMKGAKLKVTLIDKNYDKEKGVAYVYVREIK